MNKLRPIAIYLPQFHPIPENDKWWGKGFTEWTNVTRARPLFKGHYQPRLPADLGFYDLRLSEVREAQAQLAKEHNIYGFCYYHYWFNGRRLLERPFQEVFESGKPDFPFMLCWANENWTRRWDGHEQEILLKQEHTREDDLDHIRVLIDYFRDSRYIRVDGKPFFVIYKPELFPNINKTLELWRNEARKEGIGELYLAYMQSPRIEYDSNMEFDAAIEFSVRGIRPYYDPRNERVNLSNFFPKLKRRIKLEFNRKILIKIKPEKKYITYEEFIEEYFRQEELALKMYPSVFPGWDNTARRQQNGDVLKNSTPELYKMWLHRVAENFKPFSQEENFIFINAWNEWAEGNHLEPCKKWGDSYLKATKEALADYI